MIDLVMKKKKKKEERNKMISRLGLVKEKRRYKMIYFLYKKYYKLYNSYMIYVNFVGIYVNGKSINNVMNMLFFISN